MPHQVVNIVIRTYIYFCLICINACTLMEWCKSGYLFKLLIVDSNCLKSCCTLYDGIYYDLTKWLSILPVSGHNALMNGVMCKSRCLFRFFIANFNCFKPCFDLYGGTHYDLY